MRQMRIAQATLLAVLMLFTTQHSAKSQTAAKPASPPAGTPAPQTPAQLQAATALTRTKWTGDFDAMVKRRVVRILVPHSRTTYFVDKGQPRGIAYEAMTAFEEQINKKRGNLRVHVVFFPTTRDRLIPDLLAGLGTSRSRA
jgi:hypothetical protein